MKEILKNTSRVPERSKILLNAKTHRNTSESPASRVVRSYHLFFGVRTSTTLRKSQTQVNFVWDLKNGTGKKKKVKPNLEKTLKSNL